MDKFHIPQQIDEPFRLMLWTMDELTIFLVPFLTLLLIFNQPIMGVLIGTSGVFLIKKLKGEQGHYFIYYLMYWYLPAVVKFKVIPPSHFRRFIG